MGVGTEEEEAKARAKPGLGRWAAAPARGGRAGTEGGRASVSPFCVRTPSARVRFPIKSSPPSRAAWTAETHGHLRAPGTVLGRAGKSRTEEPRGLVSGAAGGAGGVSPARLCCADPQPRRRRPSAGARRPAFPKSAVRRPAIQVQVAGCTVSLLQLEKAVSSKVLDSEHRPRPGGRQKVQAPAHGVGGAPWVGGAPSCVKCRIARRVHGDSVLPRLIYCRGDAQVSRCRGR